MKITRLMMTTLLNVSLLFITPASLAETTNPPVINPDNNQKVVIDDSLAQDMSAFRDSDIGDLGNITDVEDRATHAQLVINLVAISVVAFLSVQLGLDCLTNAKRMGMRPFSFWIFELASAGMLAFEIYYLTQFEAFGFNESNKILRLKYLTAKDQALYEGQLKSLQVLYDLNEENLKLIKYKLIALGIVSGVYLLATGMAVYEHIQLSPDSYLACASGSDKEGATKRRNKAIEERNPPDAPTSSGGGGGGGSVVPGSQGSRGPGVEKPSLEGKSLWASLLSHLVGIPLALAQETSSSGEKDVYSIDLRSNPQDFEDKVLNTPLNDKLLYWYIGHMAGGAALALPGLAVVKMVDKVQDLYNRMVAPPLPRAILFGAVTAMVGTATGLLFFQKKKIEERIKILDDIKKALKQSNEGVNAFLFDKDIPDLTSYSSRAIPKALEEESYKKKQEKVSCLTRGFFSNLKVDPLCKCKKEKTCLDSNVDSLVTNFNVPGMSKAPLGQYDSLMDNIGSGNLGGLNSVSGSAQARLARKNRQGLERLKGILNKQRAAQKLPAIDFPKYEDHTVQSLLKAVPSLLRKQARGAGQGGDQRGLYENGGGGLTSEEMRALEDKTPAQILAQNQGQEGALGAAPRGTGNDNESHPSTDPVQDLSFLLGEDEEDGQEIIETPGIAGKDVLRAEGDDLELGDDYEQDYEISDRENTNIFKLISLRYLKSAYPLFFRQLDPDS